MTLKRTFYSPFLVQIICSDEVVLTADASVMEDIKHVLAEYDLESLAIYNGALLAYIGSIVVF